MPTFKLNLRAQKYDIDINNFSINNLLSYKNKFKFDSKTQIK